MNPITAYQHLTETIVAVTGFSRPMLHIHAGMAIYLLSQLMLGERRGSMVSLTMVLAIELCNEMMNRLYWGSWRWDDTIPDIVTTLFWPASCVAVSRFRRWRWRRSMTRAEAMAPLWPAQALPAST